MGDIARINMTHTVVGPSLMGRAKLGDDGGVSLFYPYRASGGKMSPGTKLMFRGMNSEGKVHNGFPYRGADGKLYARTLTFDEVVPSPCSGCGSLPCTYTLTASGFTRFPNGSYPVAMGRYHFHPYYGTCHVWANGSREAINQTHYFAGPQERECGGGDFPNDFEFQWPIFGAIFLILVGPSRPIIDLYAPGYTGGASLNVPFCSIVGTEITGFQSQPDGRIVIT